MRNKVIYQSESKNFSELSFLGSFIQKKIFDVIISTFRKMFEGIRG